MSVVKLCTNATETRMPDVLPANAHTDAFIPTADVLVGGRACRIVDLPGFAGDRLYRLPWLHRVLVENLVRRCPADDPALLALPEWLQQGRSDAEIPFYPCRVLMHDTT